MIIKNNELKTHFYHYPTQLIYKFLAVLEWFLAVQPENNKISVLQKSFKLVHFFAKVVHESLCSFFHIFL